jgi:DNA-binding MarR family transcriptional regulator
MAELGMDPRHVVLLRLVAAAAGKSQQALGEQMQLPPSRMVSFVDELESRGMLIRRPDPDDRRVKALYLTDRGREVLAKVMKVSAEHETLLCTGLGAEERRRLIELLGRIASAQGLTPGVHPGVAFGGPPKS